MTKAPALYQEVTNQRGEVNGIMRLSDRMIMPLDCGGLDWQGYLDYVKNGGLVIAVDVPNKKAQLAQAKQTLLKQLAQAAQVVIEQAVQDIVPKVEKDSYLAQAAEAQAWALDKSSPTPMLEGIAAARNIDLDELRQKALDKSRAWQAMCASVIGQRQAFEDQIKKMNDINQLNKIVPKFHLPTLG